MGKARALDAWTCGAATVLLLLLVGGLARASSADETADAGLRRARDEARAASVEGLETLARWCFVRKLLGERAQIAEEILSIDSDHESARRWLRYTRAKDGTWQRRGRYTPPRNRGTKASLERVPQQRAKALSDAFAILETAFLRQGASASPVERQRTIDFALRLRPSAETFRVANGEVRVGHGWRLQESVVADRSATELRELLGRLADTTPKPDDTTLSPLEEKLPFEWSKRLSTPVCRVLGTGRPGEVYWAARAVHRGCCLARSLFDYQRALEPDLTVWLLASRREHELIVGVLPYEGKDKERYLRAAGFWIPVGPTFIDSSRTAEGRVDGAVRMLISHDLQALFPKAMDIPGISEALGLYLTHKITGTRLSVVTKNPQYGAGDEADGPTLEGDGQGWLELARNALERDELPSLVELMGTAQNSLSWYDLLCANAFAAYLIEGRPKERVDFLMELDASGVVDTACLEAFGLPLPAIDRRMQRWLRERTRR